MMYNKYLFSFLFSLFTLLNLNAQVNLSNGLVAYYPFTGNPNDASGNGHHGVLVNGGTLTNDRFGNPNAAYRLDGIDDYIKVTDNGAFSNARFSISIWFQTSSSLLQTLIGKRDFSAGGTGGAQYQFAINYAPFPGYVSNLVGNNSTCNSIPGSSYINTGKLLCTEKWYHAVVTFDGTTHKLFLDGILMKTDVPPFNGMLTGCNSEIRFGNWWQQDMQAFNGSVDDIRWYNRALNQAEIDSLFNKYVSNESSIPTEAGANFSVCNNAPFTLNVNAPGAIEYAWTPRQFLNDSTLQSPTATINTTTKFYVRVKNANGCTGRDSVTVTLFSPALFSVSPPQSTCAGTQAQLNAEGGDEYSWSPANLVSNAVIKNPVTNITGTQLFTVNIKQNTCNQSAVLSVLVTVLPPPSLSVSKSNDLDCSTDQAQLSASSNTAVSYLWAPAVYLNDATASNPVAKAVSTTKFYVTAKDIRGCEQKDSVTVFMKEINKGFYGVPGAFTPNGDGINDCFGVKKWGPMLRFSLIIYNRWGEEIFRSDDPSKCWDGLYKSARPEPGNYVYYIRANTICGEVIKKGNVLLLR
ncbi:MAG: LamG-like jellyroll fold domain-containing protein [Ferruginibacter sp.]